jgi:c-di-GMP-binding flagellar brake protein YcgR
MSSLNQDRRKHPRVNVRAPIEFHPEGSTTLRTATADLSPGGCYLKMLFTFPVGTTLELSLVIPGQIVRAKAVVVSRELQVGNGIQFTDMSVADQHAIREYMDSAMKGKLAEKKGAK